MYLLFAMLSDQTVALSEEVQLLQQQLQGECDQRAVVEQQLSNLQTEKHRLEAKVKHYKDHASSNNSNMSVFHEQKVEALKEEVQYWQERYSEHEAQMEAFLGNQSIAAFKDDQVHRHYA